MNQNYSIIASSILNMSLCPCWEVPQTGNVALPLVNLLTSLTCSYSLINAVTTEFRFGFLIRGANEKGSEGLIDI